MRRKRSLKNKRSFKVSKKVKTYVAKAIKHEGERKYRTTIVVANPVAGTPITYLINGFVRGNARTQREANQVIMSAVKLRIETENAGVLVSCRVRVMVIQDRQAAGTVSTVIPTNYLEGYAAGNDIVAPVDFDKTTRFKILRDKTWILTPQGGATDQAQMKFHKINIRWKKGLRVQYNQGDTAAETDIQKNALYVVYFSDTAVGAGINVATTVFFRDS